MELISLMELNEAKSSSNKGNRNNNNNQRQGMPNGEEISVFTYLYLSAGAPALGEAKGLTHIYKINNKI